jgi:hypothetical protein
MPTAAIQSREPTRRASAVILQPVTAATVERAAYGTPTVTRLQGEERGGRGGEREGR